MRTSSSAPSAFARCRGTTPIIPMSSMPGARNTVCPTFRPSPTTGMFGGNSNWRGPIWMPVNALIIRALLQYYLYYGDDFTVECPTGSGRRMTLYQVAEEIARRLSNIFVKNADGRRPVLRRNPEVPGGSPLAGLPPVLRVFPRRQRGGPGRQPSNWLDGRHRAGHAPLRDLEAGESPHGQERRPSSRGGSRNQHRPDLCRVPAEYAQDVQPVGLSGLRPFIYRCGCLPGPVIRRSRELHHEQTWTRPLRRRLPGGSLSPGPGPLSPRRGDSASGDPHLRRVRRQYHRCPPGAQLGPLQRLAQRVRSGCFRVDLFRASRCPQSDCPSLSLVPPRALAAPAAGTSRIAN